MPTSNTKPTCIFERVQIDPSNSPPLEQEAERFDSSFLSRRFVSAEVSTGGSRA